MERHNGIRMKIEEKYDQRFKVSPRKSKSLFTYSSAFYILHNYKKYLLCVCSQMDDTNWTLDAWIHPCANDYNAFVLQIFGHFQNVIQRSYSHLALLFSGKNVKLFALTLSMNFSCLLVVFFQCQKAVQLKNVRCSRVGWCSYCSIFTALQ